MIGTGQTEQNPKATAPAWPYWSQDFRENSVLVPCYLSPCLGTPLEDKTETERRPLATSGFSQLN